MTRHLRFAVWAAGALAAASVYAHSAVGASVDATPIQDAKSAEQTQPQSVGVVRGSFTSHQRLLTRGATSQRDVIVYLTADRASTQPSPTKPAVVSQERLRFDPHVLAIRCGSKVQFVNKDDVDHNVFSAEKCCSMDLMMSPRSEKEVAFDEVGVSSIVCRLHPEMSLWIVVLRDPWFTQIQLDKQKDGDGSAYTADYKIPDVPPGQYTLTFWNKKLRPVEYKVTVAAGEETRLDISIDP